MKKTGLRALVVLCGLCLAVACSDDGDTNTDGGGSTTKKDGGSSTKQDKGGSSTAMGPMCLRSCKTADDCCPKSPCDKGMVAQICSKGYCKFVGCKTDADCKVAGVAIGTCGKTNTSGYQVGVCGKWCTKDTECTAPLKCVTKVANFAKKQCGVACKEDKDCLSPALKCDDKTYCGAKTSTSGNNCTKDSECPATAGLSKCNTKTKMCECESDKKCQDALKAAGGTYKCTKWPY